MSFMWLGTGLGLIRCPGTVIVAVDAVVDPASHSSSVQPASAVLVNGVD